MYRPCLVPLGSALKASAPGLSVGDADLPDLPDLPELPDLPGPSEPDPDVRP
jgi:hypothetical protein